MLKILPLMFVSLVVAVSAWANESNEWLGVFVGDTLPEYSIKRTQIVFTRNADVPTESVRLERAIADLGNNCKSAKGVAVVNIRISFALGAISERLPTGERSISPAKEYFAYADCVLEVVPSKPPQ